MIIRDNISTVICKTILDFCYNSVFLSDYTVACLQTLKPSSEKTNRTRDLHPFCLVYIFLKNGSFNEFTEVGILLRIFTYLCKHKRLCNNTFIPGCDADLDRRESGGQSL